MWQGRCKIRVLPFLGFPCCIFTRNTPGQFLRLSAFTLFSLEQPDLGERAILTPVFGLQVAKACRSVWMEAAGKFFVPVLPVQAFRDAIAHVPVMRTTQFGNGKHT